MATSSIESGKRGKHMISRQKLHQNGPELSRLVWGAWRACESPETNSPEKLAKLIEACLELGITSFDHADIYGGYKAEALFGAALRLTKLKRETIQIISKCDILINDRAALTGAPAAKFGIKHYDTSAAYMKTAVEASLKALGSDYLDLLRCIVLIRLWTLTRPPAG